MKTIGPVDVQTDLLTNDKYLTTYPDLESQIHKYRKSPGCGPCRAVIDTVLSRGATLLAAVYGEPVELDLSRVSSRPPTVRRHIVVERVSPEGYAALLEQISKNGPQVPTAFYVPEEKLVYVTYIRSVLVRE